MTLILTVLLKSAPQAARYICYFALQILNKEAVDKVRGEREIPDVQPGCIIQMRLVSICILSLLLVFACSIMSVVLIMCVNSKFLRTSVVSLR